MSDYTKVDQQQNIDFNEVFEFLVIKTILESKYNLHMYFNLMIRNISLKYMYLIDFSCKKIRPTKQNKFFKNVLKESYDSLVDLVTEKERMKLYLDIYTHLKNGLNKNSEHYENMYAELDSFIEIFEYIEKSLGCENSQIKQILKG